MANKRNITAKPATHQGKGGLSSKYEILPPTPDQVSASLRIVDRLANMGVQVPQIPSNHIETLQNAIKHEIIPTGYESFKDFMQKIKALGVLDVFSSDE